MAAIIREENSRAIIRRLNPGEHITGDLDAGSPNSLRYQILANPIRQGVTVITYSPDLEMFMTPLESRAEFQGGKLWPNEWSFDHWELGRIRVCPDGA